MGIFPASSVRATKLAGREPRLSKVVLQAGIEILFETKRRAQKHPHIRVSSRANFAIMLNKMTGRCLFTEQRAISSSANTFKDRDQNRLHTYAYESVAAGNGHIKDNTTPSTQ